MFSKICASMNPFMVKMNEVHRTIKFIFTTNTNTKDITCLWNEDYTPTTTPYYSITIRPLNVVHDDIAEECARG